MRNREDSNKQQSPKINENSTVNLSPFSKHLPTPTAPQASSKIKKKLSLPKAITGSAFREMLLEKKAQKDREEKNKQARKEERERKRLERQADIAQKQREREMKKQQRILEKREKSKAKYKQMQKENISDDSDDALEIQPGKCYKCSHDYGIDFIQCDNCQRRFHVECVKDEFEFAEGLLPFECKYC